MIYSVLSLLFTTCLLLWWMVDEKERSEFSIISESQTLCRDGAKTPVMTLHVQTTNCSVVQAVLRGVMLMHMLKLTAEHTQEGCFPILTQTLNVRSV